MFPNLKAEVNRKGLTTIEIANGINKPKQWLENRISCKASLPIEIGIEIHAKYFSEVPISYLYSETPIFPTELNSVKQTNQK